MPNGLPPEVVEAMALVIAGRQTEQHRQRGGDWPRERHRETARQLLAALPACVLVSDGQGNVEEITSHDLNLKWVEEHYTRTLQARAVTGEYDGQVQAFRYKAEER